MFLLLSTFWKSKISIYQHFGKQKYPFINILEYYIIDQDILKDFFHFIQFLLKLRFNEIPYSFIEAYERLLHIFSCENQGIFVTFLNRTVCEIFKFLISDRLLHQNLYRRNAAWSVLLYLSQSQGANARVCLTSNNTSVSTRLFPVQGLFELQY